MEIAPGVHLIPTPTWAFMGVHEPKVYLVMGEECALIDAGLKDKDAAKSRLDYVKQLTPAKLKYIIVTHPHPDHIGGCNAIKKATGAQVVMHSLAFKLAKSKYRVTGDILVGDGDVLDIGGLHLETVYTPGHSISSICVYAREGKIMFTGDHVLGSGSTFVDAPECEMSQYLDSLEKLLKYDISMICPGHGPLVHEPKRKIRELIELRRERERQVLSCLRQGRKTVDMLVAEMYPELDERITELARRQILAHLTKLVKENKVAVTGKKYALK